MPPEGEKQEKTYDSIVGSVEAKDRHIDLVQQEKDLKDFLESQSEGRLTPEKRREFGLKLAEWENNNNVEKIRTAGVSETENRTNWMRRHALLSSAYLQKTSEQGKGYKFTVDFKGNNLAEWRVGAADMLPPTVLKIKLTRKDGSSSIGIRTQNPGTKRIGYFDEQSLKQSPPSYDYLSVHSGDAIEILETTNISAMGSQQTIKEHVEIYRRGAAGADVVENDEARHDIATNRTYSSPEEMQRSQVQEYSQAQRSAMANGPTKPNEGARNYFSWAEYCGSTEAEVKRFIITEDPVTHERPIKFLGVPIYGGVNKLILPYLREAEARMKAAGITYPIKRMESFNYRRVKRPDGSYGTNLSKHAFGSAFDMNAMDNQQSTQGDIPDTIVRIFEALGFTWGGRWGGALRDPMHFELAVNPFKNQGRLQTDEGKKYADAILRQPPAGPAKPSAGGAAPSGQKAPSEGRSLDVANRQTKNFREIAEDHATNLENMQINPNKMGTLNTFKNKALQNRARYEAVARETGMPWKLIAAIHWQESGMRFDRYLHNGDPLGKPTTHVPRGRMFSEWEPAAIDAMRRSQSVRNVLGINAETKDLAALCAFAEGYNGIGCRNAGRGPSAYVYGGTNIYQGGMYTADNKFDANKWWPGIGVAAMLKVLQDI